jgi:hypothetical protein
MPVQRYYLPVFRQQLGQLNVADLSEATAGHGFRLVTTVPIPVPFRGPMCVSWEMMITPVLADEQIDALASSSRSAGIKKAGLVPIDLTKKGLVPTTLTNTIAGPSPVQLVETTDSTTMDYFSWKLVGLLRPKKGAKRAPAPAPPPKSESASQRLKKHEGPRTRDDNDDVEEHRTHPAKAATSSDHEDAIQNTVATVRETQKVSASPVPRQDVVLNESKVAFRNRRAAVQGSNAAGENGVKKSQALARRSRTHSTSLVPTSSVGSRHQSHEPPPDGFEKFEQESKQPLAARRRQETILLLRDKVGSSHVSPNSAKVKEGEDDRFDGLVGSSGMFGSGGINIGGFDEKVLATGTYAEGVLHSPCPHGTLSTYFVDTDGQGLVGLQLWMKACNKDGFGHGVGNDQLLCATNLTVHKRTMPPDWLALGADSRFAESNASGAKVGIDYQDMLKMYEKQCAAPASDRAGCISEMESSEKKNGLREEDTILEMRLRASVISQRAARLSTITDNCESDESDGSSSSSCSSSTCSDSARDSHEEGPNKARALKGQLPSRLMVQCNVKTRDLVQSNVHRLTRRKTISEGMETEYEINGRKITRVEMVMSMMQKKHNLSGLSIS